MIVKSRNEKGCSLLTYFIITTSQFVNNLFQHKMRNKFPQYSLLNNSSDPYNDVYVAHLYSVALELRTHFCRLILKSN